MAEDQEQQVEIQEIRSNPFKDPKEWIDLAKWIIVFIVSTIAPLVLLTIFWVVLKPDNIVLLIFSLIYFCLTYLLVKPLVSNLKNEK